ncbi:MAG: PspA/IM30 family protein [Dehalococcoidia bacterium]|nr:PspA/IM30 family protein [Dehalococcoidia bacterium]
MGVIDRVAIILKANLNDLLDRAEDPEKMVRQLLTEMSGHLIQVRTQVAMAAADEQKLRSRCRENEAQTESWQRRAEAAVAAGDDDLARQALSRHNTYAQLAEGFREQLDKQTRQVTELKEALSQLQAQIHTAEARRDLLVTRIRRAKAEMSIRQTMSGANGTSLLSEFARMEERVEQGENQAEAYRELDKDTLEVKFQQLEESDNLDRQLAAMKSRLLVAPGGQEASDAVEQRR